MPFFLDSHVRVLTAPLQPNGANLTGGGNGTSSDTQASQSSNPYVPFNGPNSGAITINPTALSVVLLSGLLGMAAVFTQL